MERHPRAPSVVGSSHALGVMPTDDETIDVDPKTQAVFDKKGYVVLKKISQGAFGRVYKVRQIESERR